MTADEVESSGTTWSEIRSVRFDLGSYVLTGGESFKFIVTMKAPTTMADGSPLVDGAMTWNKLAGTGNQVDNRGATTELLATEYPWVSTKVSIPKGQPTPSASPSATPTKSPSQTATPSQPPRPGRTASPSLSVSSVIIPGTGSTSSPSTSSAPTPSASAGQGALPFTGGVPLILALIGIGLLGAGVLTWWGPRRKLARR